DCRRLFRRHRSSSQTIEVLRPAVIRLLPVWRHQSTVPPQVSSGSLLLDFPPLNIGENTQRIELARLGDGSEPVLQGEQGVELPEGNERQLHLQDIVDGVRLPFHLGEVAAAQRGLEVTL